MEAHGFSSSVLKCSLQHLTMKSDLSIHSTKILTEQRAGAQSSQGLGTRRKEVGAWVIARRQRT